MAAIVVDTVAAIAAVGVEATEVAGSVAATEVVVVTKIHRLDSLRAAGSSGRPHFFPCDLPVRPKDESSVSNDTLARYNRPSCE